MIKIDPIKLIKVNAVGFSIGDNDPNNKIEYERREYNLATVWLAFTKRERRVSKFCTSQQFAQLATHELEEYFEHSELKKGAYISNGALIKAAIDFGFRVKRCAEPQHYNAFINIGDRKLESTYGILRLAFEIAKQRRINRQKAEREVEEQFYEGQTEEEQERLINKQYKQLERQCREEKKESNTKTHEKTIKEKKISRIS